MRRAQARRLSRRYAPSEQRGTAPRPDAAITPTNPRSRSAMVLADLGRDGPVLEFAVIGPPQLRRRRTTWPPTARSHRASRSARSATGGRRPRCGAGHGGASHVGCSCRPASARMSHSTTTGSPAAAYTQRIPRPECSIVAINCRPHLRAAVGGSNPLGATIAATSIEGSSNWRPPDGHVVGLARAPRRSPAVSAATWDGASRISSAGRVHKKSTLGRGNWCSYAQQRATTWPSTCTFAMSAQVSQWA